MVSKARNPGAASGSMDKTEQGLQTELQARIEAERAWLSKQKGMNSWENAVPRLVEQVMAWNKELRFESASAEDDGNLAIKLWDCWCYHWKTATGDVEIPARGQAIDGFHVAHSIRAGIGFTGEGHLGGDVVADMSLAFAAVQGNGNAIRTFEDRFKTRLMKLASQFRIVARDLEEWWNDFLSMLVSGPSPRLAKYAGKCGLEGWLRTVARRDLMRKNQGTKVRGESLGPFAMDPRGTVEDEVWTKDCEQLLRRKLAIGLRNLQPSALALLLLRVIDDLTFEQIGKIARIHKGSVKRRLDSVIDQIREALNAHVDDAVTQCLQQLETNRHSFSDLLSQALRDRAKEAS